MGALHGRPGDPGGRAGVTVSTLLITALVLVCPLMMFFMMRSGHGHGGGDSTGQQTPPHERHDQQGTASLRDRDEVSR
jgi:hypothetical protein